jgi:hypothetical protein
MEDNAFAQAVAQMPEDDAPKLIWADHCRDRSEDSLLEHGLRYAVRHGKMPRMVEHSTKPWQWNRLPARVAGRRGERPNEIHSSIFDPWVRKGQVRTGMRASFGTLARAFEWLGAAADRTREDELERLIAGAPHGTEP